MGAKRSVPLLLRFFMDCAGIVTVDHRDLEEIIGILDGKMLVQIPQRCGFALGDRENRTDGSWDVGIFEEGDADVSEVCFDGAPAGEKPR